jgi:hypothetical protein
VFRKDGTILPEGTQRPSSMESLIIVGITEDWRVAVFWPNDRLRDAIVNRCTPSELQRIKDAIITAFNDSVNKRLPTVINLS